MSILYQQFFKPFCRGIWVFVSRFLAVLGLIIGVFLVIWSGLSWFKVRLPVAQHAMVLGKETPYHCSLTAGYIIPAYLKARFSVTDVRIAQAAQTLVHIPQITGSVSPFRALFQGMIYRVHITKPHVRVPLQVLCDKLQKTDASVTYPLASWIFPWILPRLFHWPSLVIHQGHVSLDDAPLLSAISIAPQPGGIEMRAQGSLGVLQPLLAAQGITTFTGFTGALSGSLVRKNNHLVGACTFITEKGQVALKGHSAVYAVTDTAVSLSYDPAQIMLTAKGITHGDVPFSGETILTFSDHRQSGLERDTVGALLGSFNAQVGRFETKRLAQFWPEFAGTFAHKWVAKNLSQGHLEKTWIKGTYAVPASRDTVSDVAFHGGMDLRGVTVKYHEKMPALTSVNSTACFTDDHFHFVFNRGEIKAIKLVGGEMWIKGLAVEKQVADMTLMLDSPLSDALAFIDMPLLRYATDVGIVPKKTSGHAKTTLRLTFPLAQTVTLNDLQVQVNAQMTDVKLLKIPVLGDHILTKGAFNLVLKDHQLSLTGQGNLPELCMIRLAVNTRADEQQNILRKQQQKIKTSPQTKTNPKTATPISDLAPPPRRTIAITFPQVKPGALSRFGLPLSSLGTLTGALAVTFVSPVTQPRNHQVFTAIFEGTRGTPVPALFKRLIASDKHPVVLAVSGLLADTAPIQKWTGSISQNMKPYMTGDFSFKAGKGHPLQHFAIKGTPRLGGSLSIMGTKKDQWDVVITGKNFDFDGLFSGADTTTGPDFSGAVHLTLSNVLYKHQLFLQNLAGTGQFDTGQCIAASLEGALSEKNDTVVFTVASDAATQTRHLSFTCNSFGRLLKQLNPSVELEGELLRIKATKKYVDPHAPWKGDFQITQTNIVNVPVMTNILRLLSPFALFELSQAGQKGMLFSQFQGEFSYRDQVLSLFSAYGMGLNLSLSVAGDIDFQKGYLSLSGALTPFSIFNTLLGHIPLIGQILTGGKGEGILAISYHADGPFDNVVVAANPLSVLTPGFLRKIMSAPHKKLTPDVTVTP